MVGFCTVIHKAQPKHALVASFFLYIIYRVINIWGACKISLCNRVHDESLTVVLLFQGLNPKTLAGF